MAGPRLLVVDDERQLAGMLARALESDFEPVVAYSVAGAVALLEGGAFDAVLTDFDLPDGNGAEILKAAERTNARCYRCVVSGRTHSEIADICADIAHGIWRKPLFPHQFVAAFAAHTGR